jgi:hypothetical protein
MGKGKREDWIRTWSLGMHRRVSSGGGTTSEEQNREWGRLGLQVKNASGKANLGARYAGGARW